METKTTVLISGKAYQFNSVTSPADREMLMAAARDINMRFESLKRKHPEKTEAEIGSLIALNKELTVMELKKEIRSLKTEIESLRQGLESYLEKIG